MCILTSTCISYFSHNSWFEFSDGSLRCFVARQLLLQIYAHSSVKFPQLKWRLCKKNDKYENIDLPILQILDAGYWGDGWKVLEESPEICFQMVMEVILRSAPVVCLDTFLTSQTYRSKFLKVESWGYFLWPNKASHNLVCVAGSLQRARCLSIGSWMRIGRWESPILVKGCSHMMSAAEGGVADDYWEPSTMVDIICEQALPAFANQSNEKYVSKLKY